MKQKKKKIKKCLQLEILNPTRVGGYLLMFPGERKRTWIDQYRKFEYENDLS